jgi:hypothetical protein
MKACDKEMAVKLIVNYIYGYPAKEDFMEGVQDSTLQDNIHQSLL